MIMGRRSIEGWPSGTAPDSEDTLDFSVLSQIRPMIETYPLDRAPEAYDRMMSGKARFRMVLNIDAATA
jgi:D-arabinose 1-dehydrogenase-like Zn-dependent alcohol dehydrogenase